MLINAGRKKLACQLRQDRLSNPPNYYVFNFILVHLFYGRTKRLRPDPIVGLGARLVSYLIINFFEIGTLSYHCRFTQSKPDKESHVAVFKNKLF